MKSSYILIKSFLFIFIFTHLKSNASPISGELTDGSVYHIENIWAKRFLSGSSNVENVKVRMSNFNHSWKSIKWKIVKESNFYRLKSLWGNYYLTGSEYPGGQATLQNLESNSSKQKWKIEKNADGSFRIKCLGTGLYLHAQSQDLWSNVTLLTLNINYSSQKWRFTAASDVVNSRKNEFNWQKDFGEYTVKSWTNKTHEGTNYFEWDTPLTYLSFDFSTQKGGQKGGVYHQKRNTPGYPEKISNLNGGTVASYRSIMKDMNLDEEGKLFVGVYGWNHNKDEDWPLDGWIDEWYVWNWSNVIPNNVVNSLKSQGATVVGTIQSSNRMYTLLKMERNFEYSGWQWHAIPNYWSPEGASIDMLPILKEWKKNGLTDYIMYMGVDVESLWGLNSGNVIFDNIVLPKFKTSNVDSKSQIVEENRFIISPNPANSKLYVRSDLYTPVKIQIIDNIGKIFFETRGVEQLDIDFLSSGNYFVRVLDNKNEWHTYKFIKM